jgi:exosortase/archaeosortase family protein
VGIQAVTADALPSGSRSAQHRKPAGHRAPRGRATRPARPARPRGGLASRLAAGALRLVACAGLCGLAVLAVAKQFRIRVFEAWLSSHVLAAGARVPAGYWSHYAAVWFAPDPSDQIGLIITPECTIALLIVPFLLLTAGTVWIRMPLRWPLIALAAAVLLLTAVNQLRLLTVTWFILGMGTHSGFYWGHTLVGSLITIAGIAVSLALYGFILLRRGNAARGR